MDNITLKKARRNIIIILFLSILCLILITFLPWIAVAENGSIKENLHFNYEMMRDSSSTQINDLYYSLMDILILFWTIIIIALITFLCLIFYSMVKRTLFIRILFLTSSFIIFILCVLIIYFQMIFSRTINEIEYISASMLYSPFAYAYIQFIVSFILLIFTGYYIIIIVKDSMKQFKSQKIQKDKKKIIEEKKTKDITIEREIEKSIKIPGNTEALKNSSRDAKLAEIDKLLAKKETEKDKNKVEEIIPEQKFANQTQNNLPKQKEKKDIQEMPEEENIQETKPEEIKEQIKQPFPEKKPKKEIYDHDDIHFSEHFEKALSSAIEKKQSKREPKEINKNNLEQEKREESVKTEMEENKPYKNQHEKKIEQSGKILKIKCPECNNIFSINKDTDIKSVICPKCGKEGKIVKEI